MAVIALRWPSTEERSRGPCRRPLVVVQPLPLPSSRSQELISPHQKYPEGVHARQTPADEGHPHPGPKTERPFDHCPVGAYIRWAPGTQHRALGSAPSRPTRPVRYHWRDELRGPWVGILSSQEGRPKTGRKGGSNCPPAGTCARTRRATPRSAGWHLTSK